MSTPDFTIVTAVTPDYLKKLRWCLPTWAAKPQFRGKPLLIFVHGDFKDGELESLCHLWPGPGSVGTMPWDMPKYDNVRELMLSSFVLGAAKWVDKDYFVKLDADCYFTDSQDAFKPEDFNADLCAHKWGYTKPAWWVERMAKFVGDDVKVDKKDKGSRGAKRIISFCCLHKTEFVREAARLAGDRLPIPSHDSYLWYLADRCEDRSFKRVNIKARGVNHTSRWKKIREGICAGETRWNPWLNEQLLKHVQLEVTTKCNMSCPNCDRNCGMAPSDEAMTLRQIYDFFTECREAGKTWDRIDIIGGEPALHPDVDGLWEVCREDKDLARKWRVTTNGTMKTCPDFMQLRSSAEMKKHPVFELVNMAPTDAKVKNAQACSIPWRCGLALTRYGFFLCGAGASIARVFGFDIGIKSLDALTIDALKAQQKVLCKFCGHSRSTGDSGDKQETSPSWKAAFDSYKDHELELY